MAQYANTAGQDVLCQHSVKLDYHLSTESIQEVREWMNDPERPGFWRWHLEYGVMIALISDRDVAFECRMRWG